MEIPVKRLKWLLIGLLILTLLSSCSTVGRKPQSYRLPPIAQSNEAIAQSWFDGVEPIFVGFKMGTAFAVGLDESSVYWMTAAHVVGQTENVRIGTRKGHVIALEVNQDLAIVRTNRSQPWGRIHRFSQTSTGTLAIGVGHSWFSGNPVTMIHIGWVVSTDFRCWNGNWRIVTNGGGRGGMSGGPLFNTRRGVIGICSFFADTGINRAANPSELCYVPGIVAGMFWNQVNRDLIAANDAGNTEIE